jgi:hypothetical protein
LVRIGCADPTNARLWRAFFLHIFEKEKQSFVALRPTQA